MRIKTGKREAVLFATIVSLALPLISCSSPAVSPTQKLPSGFAGNSLQDLGEAAFPSLLPSYIETQNNVSLSALSENQKVEQHEGREMPLVLRFDSPGFKIPDMATGISLKPTTTITTTEIQQRTGSKTLLRANQDSLVIEAKSGDDVFYGIPLIREAKVDESGSQVEFFPPRFNWYKPVTGELVQVSGDTIRDQKPTTAELITANQIDDGDGWCNTPLLDQAGWSINIDLCNNGVIPLRLFSRNPIVLEGSKISSGPAIVTPEKVTLNLTSDSVCTNCVGGKGVEDKKETTSITISDETKQKVQDQVNRLNAVLNQRFGFQKESAFLAIDFSKMSAEGDQQVIPLSLRDLVWGDYLYHFETRYAERGIWLQITDARTKKTVFSLDAGQMEDIIKPPSATLRPADLNAKLKEYSRQDLESQLKSGVVIAQNAQEIGSFELSGDPGESFLRQEIQNKLQLKLMDALSRVPEGKKASFYIAATTLSGLEKTYKLSKVTSQNVSSSSRDFSGVVYFTSDFATGASNNSSNQQIVENVDLSSFLTSITSGSVYLIVED